MNFDSFSLNPQVMSGVSAAGYTIPTPIQQQTIPAILEGRDVLGLAQTGTGKTAAFVLPILQRLMKGPRGRLRALIVAPTRELAEQTHMAIKSLGRQTNLRSVTLYGGVSALPQIKSLKAGAEIAVACPGRLLDLVEQRVLSLNNIEILVLDEGDEMLDMGFLPAIRRILTLVPPQRQTLLFSATMPTEIRSLTENFMHNPVTIEISITAPIETISHAVYPVDQTRKYDLLMELLRDTGPGQVLVFTRTKHRAKRLAEQLSKTGLQVASLQGNLSQNRRQEALDNFRSGRVKVLVATDIAARGIDVSQITHVINFDIPDTADAYIHRIGRTGRMERLGTALTLITQEDMPMVRTIERILGRPLERRNISGYEPIPGQSAPVTQPRPSSSQRRPQQSNRSSRPMAAVTHSNR